MSYDDISLLYIDGERRSAHASRDIIHESRSRSYLKRS